jgi:hypothetical protein
MGINPRQIPLILSTSLCVFLIAATCCNHLNSGGATNAEKKDAGQKELVEVDIPDHLKRQTFWENKMEEERKVGLLPLIDGFDSVEIRIWFQYAFEKHFQILVIRNSESEWHALLYSLKYNNDSILSINSFVEDKKPKSGWIEFSRRIDKLKIMTLPDFSSISQYTADSDGDFVTVEIARKKEYRIYTYQEPKSHQAVIKEAKEMEEIMLFLEREFYFNRLRVL